MKTLIIHDTSDEFGREILAYLKKNGPDYLQFIDLGQKSIQACTGCFACWLKTPGLCPIKDDAILIQKEEVNSEKVLYLCPICWGGYSPAMKIYQDRAVGRVLPFFKTYKGETHHPGRYEHSPQPFLAAYGKNLDKDEVDLFKRTGNNLNDNIHRGKIQTMIIQNSRDFPILDCLWKGEEL